MKKPPMTVLVLHEAIGADARADELDTLEQAAQISAALARLGQRVSTLQTGLDLDATLESIRARRPDIVFNLVESLGGEGRMCHFIPALLSKAGVAFTGSDSDAIYLSTQKQMAKQWMRLHGIPTPASFGKNMDDDSDHGCWIVKSLWEHASFGMDDGCVVNGTGAVRKRIADCESRYGGEWFAEQFVDGREFNISVMEEDGQAVILPIAEIGFTGFPGDKPKIVGYAAKWDTQAPEYLGTPRSFPSLSGNLNAALRRVVLKCWSSFGLGGYARVDIRVDAQGNPWVLEVNSNPCLGQDAGFAAAALEAGMNYDQLIERVVSAGLRTFSDAVSTGLAQPSSIAATAKG